MLRLHLCIYLYVDLFLFLRKSLQDEGEEIGEEMEDEFYMRRLDAGLFSLQLIDCIIMEVCSSGVSSVNNSTFH